MGLLRTMTMTMAIALGYLLVPSAVEAGDLSDGDVLSIGSVVRHEAQLASQVVTIKGVLTAGRHGAGLVDCPHDEEGVGLLIQEHPASDEVARLAKLIHSSWLKKPEGVIWVTVTGRLEVEHSSIPARVIKVERVDELVEEPVMP